VLLCDGIFIAQHEAILCMHVYKFGQVSTHIVGAWEKKDLARIVSASSNDQWAILLLTPFRRRQLLKRTSGVALWSDADGLRPRAGRSATWREAAVLSGQARTVRGTGPDGPRPGARARISCLTAGRSAP
jgi:hypothetical protein